MCASMQFFYFFVKFSVEGLTSSSLPTDWTKVPYEGVDFRGSDIGFDLMDDAESCQKTCTLDANCQFYTYVSNEFLNPDYRYIFCTCMQTIAHFREHTEDVGSFEMNFTLLSPFFINS